MGSELISIGAMAKMNHTTVPTLRLYDELGLLTPAYINPESGYRYYDIKQNARLDMIQYMKELGMNLKEVGDILNSNDINLIESVLIKKKEQTRIEIERLKMKRDALSRSIYSIERYRKSPRAGTVTLEYIAARRIYAMQTKVNFYDYSIDMYENILNQLKTDLIAHDLPQIYFCNAGTFLRKDDFLAQRFVSDGIFVFVDDNFPLKSKVKIIENGMYACIYLDDFDREKEYAMRLLDYCRENDYEISGDYICEVLTEFNVFDSDRRSMFLRLQVPVLFNK